MPLEWLWRLGIDMLSFCENINRLNEVRELLKKNPDVASFYKEPEKIDVSWDDNWYHATLICGRNDKKLSELFDKWYFQDRNGVLYKVKYGGYGEVNDTRWFINHNQYNELVKLGLKIDYPLTHTDALRFLEGMCNGSIYKKNEDCFSDELKEIMNKKFKSYWDSPDYVTTKEHHFEVCNYALDNAIGIVNKKNN